MTSQTDRPTLLLTGGTGVLGRALLDELSGDFDIICLRNRTAVDDPRVRELAADLTDPRLGLDAGRFERLVQETDIVLHCAAATNWKLDAEEIHRVNLEGTTTMIDVAARAGAPLYYMSTAFVATPLKGNHKEQFPGPAAYLDSKIAAEQAWRDSGLPGAILRPSVVMGDSRTGEMAGAQGLTKAFGAVVKGQAPVVPGAPSARIDMIPQDFVVSATGELVRAGVTSGEYWLTAGSAAVRLDEAVSDILDFAERYGPRPHSPRLIPVEAVDRLLLPMLDSAAVPRLVRRRFQEHTELLLVFQRELPFESSLGTPNCGAAPTREGIRAALIRTVEAWARKPGGLRAARAEAAAMAGASA